MVARHNTLREPPLTRWAAWSLGAAAFASSLLTAPVAWAAGTLIVGMTAGDIPVTTGNPDQGQSAPGSKKNVPAQSRFCGSDIFMRNDRKSNLVGGR